MIHSIKKSLPNHRKCIELWLQLFVGVKFWPNVQNVVPYGPVRYAVYPSPVTKPGICDCVLSCRCPSDGCLLHHNDHSVIKVIVYLNPSSTWIYSLHPSQVVRDMDDKHHVLRHCWNQNFVHIFCWWCRVFFLTFQCFVWSILTAF